MLVCYYVFNLLLCLLICSYVLLSKINSVILLLCLLIYYSVC